MFRFFPKKLDCPEGRQITGGGLYWVVYIVFLPFFIELLCTGEESIATLAINACIAYHIINLIVIILVFRHYLEESFWVIRLDKKRFFTAIGIGLAVLTAISVPVVLITFITGNALLFLPYPFADALLGLHSFYWLLCSPVLMGVCMVFAVPFTISCLYYAVGFATPAQTRPWLGYIIVAGLAAIPAVLLYTSQGYLPTTAFLFYLFRLPVFMCACWVYQYSDSIWGPIVFHSIVNLFSVPIMFLLIDLSVFF